jgi:hypothetical protein
MYEDIKKHLEQQRQETSSRLTLERIAPEETQGEQAAYFLSTHVTAELERHMSEMTDAADAAEAAAHPHDAAPHFGGLETQRQWEKHLTERLRRDLDRPQTAFDFTVPSGSRIIAPPYDLEWGTGNGMAFGSRADGKVLTIPKANGFSAAGIGFVLTVNEPLLAAITPQGTYDWNWASFANLPFARSRGGLGITIYTDAEPHPTLSRQPVLWSVSGLTQFTGDKGTGKIADAASPASGLGTIPLAPALVNMVPDSRYLVWVWCWQTSQLAANDPFWAFLQMAMPLVTVTASPPIVIH